MKAARAPFFAFEDRLRVTTKTTCCLSTAPAKKTGWRHRRHVTATDNGAIMQTVVSAKP